MASGQAGVWCRWRRKAALSELLILALNLLGPFCTDCVCQNKSDGCGLISQIITPFNIACSALTCPSALLCFFFSLHFRWDEISCRLKTVPSAGSGEIPHFDHTHALFTLITTIIVLAGLVEAPDPYGKARFPTFCCLFLLNSLKTLWKSIMHWQQPYSHAPGPSSL